MAHRLPLLLLLWLAPLAPGQQVVDRIVARIDDDVITLSEVRQLAAFQQLVEGRSAGRDQLLNQLVEQWILTREARADRIPMPSDAELAAELERLQGQFPSPEAHRARLHELGLSQDGVRQVVQRQLYLLRYLDFEFRPAIEVEPEQIRRYYQTEFAPRLTERGQPVPALSEVESRIREVLIQQEITRRAARWLERARLQLKIELIPDGNGR